MEIIAIISPTEVRDAGLLMSKPLCAEVGESRLANCGKLRAGNHALLSSVSHLTTTLFTPSLLPSTDLTITVCSVSLSPADDP